MFRTNRTSGVRGGVVLVALCGLVGCAEQATDETANEVARNVRVMPVATGEVTEYFEVAGPVVPVRGADISAEESGTVAQVKHDKGQRVAAGATILILDRRLLAAELTAAESMLALQQHNRDQTRRLFEAGKVSRLAMLEAESALAQARGQRDVLATRHDRAQVKAPFAGLVADRMVEPGELVAPGQRVARVIDPYTLKLEGSLTEVEVAWVLEGMAAQVTVEGAGEMLAGTVEWVGFEADPLNGKFPVEIRLPNADLALRSGAIGRARIAKNVTSEVVVVPRDAIVTQEGAPYVFVTVDDRARRLPVELGPAQGLMVAIRDGLAAGDLLVVRGQRDLRDGSLVAIRERVANGDGTAVGDPEVIRAESAATRVGAEVNR